MDVAARQSAQQDAVAAPQTAAQEKVRWPSKWKAGGGPKPPPRQGEWRGPEQPGWGPMDTSRQFAVDDSGRGRGPAKETDPHRLAQRQKQIDFGKNTLGYQRYVGEIPKSERTRKVGRGGINPWTPDKTQVCSKRSFDGQVKKWRRALHLWDPPNEEEEPVPYEANAAWSHASVNPPPLGSSAQAGGAAAEVDIGSLEEVEPVFFCFPGDTRKLKPAVQSGSEDAKVAPAQAGSKRTYHAAGLEDANAETGAMNKRPAPEVKSEVKEEAGDGAADTTLECVAPLPVTEDVIRASFHEGRAKPAQAGQPTPDIFGDATEFD